MSKSLLVSVPSGYVPGDHKSMQELAAWWNCNARVPNISNCYRFREENKFVQNILFLLCNNTEIFELMTAG